MARTLTVFAQGREITFSTSYSDQHATIDLCEYVRTGQLWSNFAKDLAKYANRGYSPKQMAWVHKLVIDCERQAVSKLTKTIFANVIKKAALEEQFIANLAERQKNEHLENMSSQIPNMSSIIPMFDSAAQKLQKPKIIFWVSTDRKIKIERQKDGSLSVIDEDYGFSGYIALSGRFHLSSHSGITPVDVQGMIDIVTDPIYYARKYGLGTGHCCFCNRPLCDEFSIAAGYGPTCAGYRGLPYGKVCLPVKSALKI